MHRSKLNSYADVDILYIVVYTAQATSPPPLSSAPGSFSMLHLAAPVTLPGGPSQSIEAVVAAAAPQVL